MITIEEIYSLMEKAKQTKLDCPVCIPSYKFRKKAWLVHNLDTIESTVYLFVYEDDYTESGYDKFKWSDNVTIIKIKEQDFKDLNLRWRGIQPKRRFIQLYMKNLGIEKYFMIDDDAKYGLYPSEQRKKGCYKISKCGIDIVLKMLLVYNTNYNILGVYGNLAFFAFTKLKGLIDKKFVAGFYLFDNSKLLFTDKNVHEDSYLFMDALKSEEKYGAIDFLDIYFAVHETVANNKLMHLNDYLENPQYINLKLTKDNEIKSYFDLKKIKNKDFSYDKNFYDIVKTLDFEKIKSYLNRKKEFEEW